MQLKITVLPDEILINKGHRTICSRVGLDVGEQMVEFRKYHLSLMEKNEPFYNDNWQGLFAGWLVMKANAKKAMDASGGEYLEEGLQEVVDGKSSFPLGFKPKPEHKLLTREAKIDLATYFLRFRCHHLDLLAKGKGERHQDWCEVFSHFIREMYRSELGKEIDETKPSDLSSIQGVFGSKELAKAAMDRLVTKGVLRFDGVHYYDKEFIVAFPKFVNPKTKVVDDIDYENLSSLDKGSLDILKEDHGDDYVKTSKFRHIRARTKHRNYNRQIMEDRAMMMSLEQEPNMGVRTNKLWQYLQDRKMRLYPDLYDQKSGIPVTE